MLGIKIIESFFKKHIVQCVLLFILFGLLASVFLNMPLGQIYEKIPYQIDPYLVSWTWHWDIHAIIHNPLNFFNANIFAPFENTLAFSETMLGTALLAWPILLFFKNNTILAYNLVVLLSFSISGLGMYLLAYNLTHNKPASFLAALIYAFAPFKLIHNIQHLHLTGMWLPFVFLYLHEFFKNQSWKNILLLTLFIILVFLTGFHYFIFLPVIFLVFGLVHLITKKFRFNKKNIIKIILAFLLLVLFFVPLTLPYLQVRQEYNLHRGINDIEGKSPGLVDYFISPFLFNYFYKNTYFRNDIEMIVGFGITILILLALSILTLLKNKKDFLYTYGLIGLIAFLISLGYYIKLTIFSDQKIIGPYAFFYHFVPGFDGIRATGRYVVFSLLSTSVLIACAVAVWWQKFKDTFKRLLASIIIIIIFCIEMAFVPPVDFTLSKEVSHNQLLSQLYAWIDSQPIDKIFLHLPMGINKITHNNYDILYVFISRHHFRKIVNGYSGYYPSGYLNLVEKLEIFEPKKDLAALKKFRVNYLIFHFGRYPEPEKIKSEILNTVRQSHNFKYVINFGDNYIYQVIYD